MDLQTWVSCVTEDARRRGLTDLVPMLEGVAQLTAVLRGAAWNGRADDTDPESAERSSLP